MNQKMRIALDEAIKRLEKMDPDEFVARFCSSDRTIPEDFVGGYSADEVYFPEQITPELTAVYENAHGAYGSAEEFHRAVFHVLNGGKAKDTVKSKKPLEPIDIPTSPLAGLIMRIRVGTVEYDLFDSKVQAYKMGHLHARQEAARLALGETDALTQQVFDLEKKLRRINSDRIWWIEECGRRRAVTDFILGQVRAAIEALSDDIQVRGGVVDFGDYRDDAEVVLEEDFQGYVSKAVSILCVATADIRPAQEVTHVDQLFDETPPEEYEKILIAGLNIPEPEELVMDCPTAIDPTPPAEDWYEWKGGQSPVHGDVFVVYRMRSLNYVHGWSRAGELDWKHTGSGADIVAFAVWPGHLKDTV